MYKHLYIIIVLLSGVFIYITTSTAFFSNVLRLTSPVYASSCNPLPGDSTHTITGNCSFPYSLDGVDAGTGSTNSGTLTIQSGVLTINASQTIVAGTINLTGGSIFMMEGSQISMNTPIYVLDNDADGWAGSWSFNTTGGAGYVRRNVLQSLTTLDCDDGSYSASNTCCTVLTLYPDADGDGYGNLDISMQACATAGWVTNSTDCYDNNANAYPGSPYCGTSHRGDGSFDYNCSASSTFCGTTYNYNSTSTWRTSAVCLGAGNICTGNRSGHNSYHYKAPVCGQGGHPCTTVFNLFDCNGDGDDCSEWVSGTSCAAIGSYGVQGCR